MYYLSILTVGKLDSIFTTSHRAQRLGLLSLLGMQRNECFEVEYRNEGSIFLSFIKIYK